MKPPTIEEYEELDPQRPITDRPMTGGRGPAHTSGMEPRSTGHSPASPNAADLRAVTMRTTAAADMTREDARAARREARQATRGLPQRTPLAQCERCGDKATAFTTGGRLHAVNLPFEVYRGEVTHRGCGGHFRLFDIEVDG